MKLRKLEHKDADVMMEWMHNPEVIKNMQKDFSSMTINDCLEFIEASYCTDENIHLAIADDKDEYMGTVSLKHISKENAEFAIVVRKSAMGKGYSEFGMHEIIRIGFEKMGLNIIYWCVNPDNFRAIAFYDKNGYQRISLKDSDILKYILQKDYYKKEQIDSYYWYAVHRSF